MYVCDRLMAWWLACPSFSRTGDVIPKKISLKNGPYCLPAWQTGLSIEV